MKLIGFAGCALLLAAVAPAQAGGVFVQGKKKDTGTSINFTVEGKQVRVVVQGSQVRAYVGNKLVSTLNVSKLAKPQIIAGPDGRFLANVGPAQLGLLYKSPPKRAELGVNVSQISQSLAQHLDLERKNCVIVLGVTKGKAAAKGGLRKYDVITKIDGDGPVTQGILVKKVAKKKPGQTMRLGILRKGKPHMLTVRLGSAPGSYSFPSLLARNYSGTYTAPTLKTLWKNVATTKKVNVAKPNYFLELTPQLKALHTFNTAKKADGTQTLQKELDQLRKELKRLEKLLDKLLRQNK